MSCVYISSSCGRGSQHAADFTPSSFLPFQVPRSHGLLAPAQSDSTLWSLLVLARPPQGPAGAGSQPREGQVGTVFSLYGTVWPIGKSNFYTPKGYRTLVIIFEKGLFKTEPYWKKSALTQSCASRPRPASGPLASPTAAGSGLRRVRRATLSVLVA